VSANPQREDCERESFSIGWQPVTVLPTTDMAVKSAARQACAYGLKGKT